EAERRGMNRIATAALALVPILAGCPDEPPPGIADGIFAPLGEALSSATDAQREVFARGREVADRRFTPDTGLGPDFYVTSCAGCHEKPVTGGGGGRYRRFFLVAQRLEDGNFNPLGKRGVQTQYTLLPGGRAPTPEGANQF